MKVIIAGATGFIGAALSLYLKKQGMIVTPLVRDRSKEGIYWNPYEEEIHAHLLEGYDVVVNLCGESIFGRWTATKKERIRKSRLKTSSFLCKTIQKLQHPPKVYIGTSAIGYYGDRGDELVNEHSPAGHGFLAELCQQWERIPALFFTDKKIRIVTPRFGIVLGKGGALKKMKTSFLLGLGAVIGSGEQKISWIAIDDLIRILHLLMENTSMQGAVNIVSSETISYREFCAKIGKILHRPVIFRIPPIVMKALLGEAADVFLTGAHVIPQRLIEMKYSFLFPSIDLALKKYLQDNSLR